MKSLFAISSFASLLVSCSVPGKLAQDGEIQSTRKKQGGASAVESRKFKCSDSREVEISKTQDPKIYNVSLKQKERSLFNEKVALVSSNVQAGKDVLMEIEKNATFVKLQGQQSGARIEFVSGLSPVGWFKYKLSTTLLINDSDELHTTDCVVQL